MNALKELVRRPAAILVRLACVVALVGLLLLAVSIIYQRPLSIILGMSLGHLVGAVALAIYVIAILVDLNAKTLPRAGQRD